jgi:hypothetical protein
MAKYPISMESLNETSEIDNGDVIEEETTDTVGEDGEVIETTTSEQEVHEVPSTELETALLEVNEQEQDIEDADECIDNAIATTEALEEHYNIVYQSLETGGLNHTAAALLNASVENYATALGYDYKNINLTTSLESFSGVSTRVAATEVSLEGVGDMIKKAWQAIIDLIKRSVEAIKNFFKFLFDSVSKLEHRAKKTKEIAQKLPNNTAKNVICNEDNSNDIRVRNALTCNGNKVTPENAAKSVNDALNNLLSKWTPEKTVDAASKVVDGLVSKSDFNIKALCDNVVSNLPTDWAHGNASDDMSKQILDYLQLTGDKKSYTINVSDMLPGDYLPFVVYNDGKENGKDKERRIYYAAGVLPFESKSKKITINAADKKKITEICDTILSAVGNIRKLETKIRGLNGKKDHFTNKLGELSKESVINAKNSNSEDSKVIKRGEVTTIFRQVIKTFDEPAVALIKYSLREMATLIRYCEISINDIRKNGGKEIKE